MNTLVSAVAPESQVLANYIHKYMDDMFLHFRNLKTHLADNATLHYIVGNSKFYETVIPVEQLYAEMMASAGFTDVQIERIRKRNSKKELYEYLVSARN